MKSGFKIRSTLRIELTWSQYRTLMRLPDPDQRDFYARLTLSGRWGSRELERQIGSMLYKREGEEDPIGLILCGSKNEQVVELLLSDPTKSIDERIRVSQYLLLNSEEAIKERLALISEAYEQGHDTLSLGGTGPGAAED